MNVEQFLYGLLRKMDHMVLNLKEVSAEEGGLDRRSGWVYVTDTHVIARGSNVRSMNYYGGFEYVDQEHTFVVGEYTFWSCGDDRVQEFIDFVNGKEEIFEDEESL